MFIPISRGRGYESVVSFYSTGNFLTLVVATKCLFSSFFKNFTLIVAIDVCNYFMLYNCSSISFHIYTNKPMSVIHICYSYSLCLIPFTTRFIMREVDWTTYIGTPDCHYLWVFSFRLSREQSSNLAACAPRDK